MEDMKQLASTVPNGLHDLLPKIDKIGAEVRSSFDLCEFMCDPFVTSGCVGEIAC